MKSIFNFEDGDQFFVVLNLIGAKYNHYCDNLELDSMLKTIKRELRKHIKQINNYDCFIIIQRLLRFKRAYYFSVDLCNISKIFHTRIQFHINIFII